MNTAGRGARRCARRRVDEVSLLTLELSVLPEGSRGRWLPKIHFRVSVPDLSRYACALSVHQGLVSHQRGGSTSLSLCDLVSLGTDESDPDCGTENPRVGSSMLCWRRRFVLTYRETFPKNFPNRVQVTR